MQLAQARNGVRYGLVGFAEGFAESFARALRGLCAVIVGRSSMPLSLEVALQVPSSTVFRRANAARCRQESVDH